MPASLKLPLPANPVLSITFEDLQALTMTDKLHSYIAVSFSLRDAVV